MKRGFTYVEVMIVIIIIGLLAAMAIPAFQKVKEAKLRRESQVFGQVVNGSTTPPVPPAQTTRGVQVMQIGDRSYYVFPKPIYDFKSIEVDGKTFILIPTQ